MSIFNMVGGGVDTSAVTATADDVLSGKIFIDSNGEEVPGNIPTVEQATPTVAVNSAGLVTASATQEKGHVAAGTKTATKQLTVQAAKTVTPSGSVQTAVASGVYTTGAIKVAAIPPSYVQLNFNVVGGTSAPSSPSANTIWINTSTEITSYVFSATQPTAATGKVWIGIGASSTVAFNALKTNDIEIYPIFAKQYIGGAWVDKTAKSYQGGKWVEWIPAGALYWGGIDITNFTGGWESLAVNIIDTVNSQNALSVENYNGYVKIYQANGGARGLYVTKNKIRINGYSSLKLSGEIYSINGNPIVVALMTDKTKNGVISSYSFAQHGITKTFDDESIITLPSSGGEYYVGIGIASSDDKYIMIKNLYLD